MIPAGLTPASDRTAAEIFGYELSTFQKTWPTLGIRPANRDGARSRIWILEHLHAVKNGQPLPQPSDQESPLDLLDDQELRLSLPAERRPTEDTWKTYKRDGATPPPDIAKDDPERGVGTDLYYRQTGAEWNAERRNRGGGPGRPIGARDTKPRKTRTDAAERLAQIAALLRENPNLTAAQLGQQVGLGEEQARRLRAKARDGGLNSQG